MSATATVTDPQARRVAPRVGRAEAEEFLFNEAELLDTWQLKDWLLLFAEDARYEMPAPDLPDDSDTGLTYSLIHDSLALIQQRALRLLKPTAHAEFPHSRTRRLITNVRVVSDDDEQAVIKANFAVFRVQGPQQTQYTGRYEHTLRKVDGGLKFVLRKVFLDQVVLDPQGRISIIL